MGRRPTDSLHLPGPPHSSADRSSFSPPPLFPFLLSPPLPAANQLASPFLFQFFLFLFYFARFRGDSATPRASPLPRAAPLRYAALPSATRARSPPLECRLGPNFTRSLSKSSNFCRLRRSPMIPCQSRLLGNTVCPARLTVSRSAVTSYHSSHLRRRDLANLDLSCCYLFSARTPLRTAAIGASDRAIGKRERESVQDPPVSSPVKVPARGETCCDACIDSQVSATDVTRRTRKVAWNIRINACIATRFNACRGLGAF